jgi:hypothetical protein
MKWLFKLHLEDKRVFKDKTRTGQVAQQIMVHGDGTAVLWECRAGRCSS